MKPTRITTLLDAVARGPRYTATAVDELGAEAVTDLVVAELRARLDPGRVAEPADAVTVELCLRHAGADLRRMLTVKPGSGRWWLDTTGATAPPAATVRVELEELLDALYGPVPGPPPSRSVRWPNADDFAAFYSPGPEFAVVQRLLAAMDSAAVPDLSALAVRYGSDKWGLHNYTPPYQRHFTPLRQRARTVLEIGVGGFADPADGGASLRMWRDFFPRALIVGLDVVDKSTLAEGRIHTMRVDQAHPAALRAALDVLGPPDIVIDDGSHISKHVLTTFDTVFPHLRAGGCYVIEDLQTAYWPSFGGNDQDLTDPATTIGRMKDLVDGLNHRELTTRCPRRPRPTDTEISGLHFYHNLVVIEKGANDEPGAPSWLARTRPPE